VRTTVTFDDDVAALLNKEMRRSGERFKQVVNRAVRLGLTAPKQPPRKPFKVTPINLGLPPDLSYDNVEELLDYLEGPFRR
jgi:hypothetical protein